MSHIFGIKQNFALAPGSGGPLLVFVVLYVMELTTIRLPKLGFDSFTGKVLNLEAHWSCVRLPKLGFESFTVIGWKSYSVCETAQDGARVLHR